MANFELNHPRQDWRTAASSPGDVADFHITTATTATGISSGKIS
jgi:hypothetical protein